MKAASEAEACPWTDASGFARDCPAADALDKELEARRPAASHVARLLADPEPRRRSIGIVLHRSLDEKAQAETHAAILYAALAETVPALDGRLAMFAAHLPASDTLDHAKVDRMARSARPRVRSIFLAFLSFDRKEEPWIAPLFTLGLADVDPAVRLGAVRGAMALTGACALWRRALGDGEDAVRHAAQRSLVGSVDFVLEDETGLFGGRGAWRQNPCGADDVSAAQKSVQRDLQARRISDVDQAVFFSGLLRVLPKERSKEPLDALRTIATDTKRPSAARTLAIRALRTREEGQEDRRDARQRCGSGGRQGGDGSLTVPRTSLARERSVARPRPSRW